MGDIQFSLIKKHLIVFASFLLLCVFLVSASLIFKQNQLDEELVINKKMKSLRVNIANINHDKSVLNQYHDRYLELVDKGFFTDEKRLSWIEQLDVTANHLILPDLSYNIDIQQQIPQSVFSSPQDLSLLKSTLTFQTSLLHEGDLLALLGDLMGLNSGLLVVDHCALSRADKSGNKPANSTQLIYSFQALCAVSWFTSAVVVDSGQP